MPGIAVVCALLAALLHVVFFIFESVLWTRPSTWKRFGIANQRDADTMKLLAFNQGFYNLFLAIGVAAGLIISSAHETAGTAIVLFGCVSMALAAVVLLASSSNMRRAALMQFIPPALAIIFIVTL